MAEPTRSQGVPHDRLTRIGDAMSKTLETHPEYQDGSDRCAIFLDSDVERRGGLMLFGYDDDADAIAAIFSHLRALFQSNGMRLELFPIEKRGEG